MTKERLCLLLYWPAGTAGRGTPAQRSTCCCGPAGGGAPWRGGRPAGRRAWGDPAWPPAAAPSPTHRHPPSAGTQHHRMLRPPRGTQASIHIGVERKKKTSKGLYRSCAALASFPGTFDLILFEAVNFEFTLWRFAFVLFCLDRRFGGLDKPQNICFLVCFLLVWFGLVWLFCRQTNKLIV